VDGNKVAGDTAYRLIFSNVAGTAGANAFAIYDNASGSNFSVKHIKIVETGMTDSPSDDSGGVFITASTGTGFEVAYNWVTGTSAPNKDGMGITLFTGLAEDSSFTSAGTVHHNLVEYRFDDGIRAGSNVSIYNNYVKEIGGSGHSDGIICQSGSYCAVYNNTLDNGAEIYLDNIANSTQGHLRIYNNVSFNSGAGGAFGVEILAEGGGSSTWDDILVLNNTFQNSGSCFRKSAGGNITTLVIKNNICGGPTDGSYENITSSGAGALSYLDANALDYNAYGQGATFPNIYNVGSILTLAGMQALSPAREVNGRTGNVSYVSSGAGDFHLASGDTVARGHGLNIGATYPFLATDKDGVTRSTWDLGAYEFIARGPAAAGGLRFTGGVRF
jgi:hypothetical protein